MIVVMMVIMFMFMIVFMVMNMPVEIVHVMVMIRFVQDHVEITAVDAVFRNSPDSDVKFLRLNGMQCSSKHFLIGTEIEKRGDRHVAADAGSAVQVKNSFHRCYSLSDIGKAEVIDH